MDESHQLFIQKTPLQIFGWVLNASPRISAKAKAVIILKAKAANQLAGFYMMPTLAFTELITSGY